MTRRWWLICAALCVCAPSALACSVNEDLGAIELSSPDAGPTDANNNVADAADVGGGDTAADDSSRSDTTVEDTELRDSDDDAGVWHESGHPNRVRISWQNGVDLEEFVLPVSLSSVGSPENVTFVHEQGAVLQSEHDTTTAWFRVAPFAVSGAVWMYCGGGPTQSGVPWTTGYVGVWHLSAGNPAADGTTVNPLAPSTFATEAGVVGTGAVMADGTGPSAYALTAPIISFPNPTVTVEAWFKLNDDSTQTTGMSVFANSNAGNDVLYMNFGDSASHTLQAGVRASGQSPITIRGQYATPSVTGWHYAVLVVRDEPTRTVELWLDGVMKGSEPLLDTWAPVNQPAAFGSDWNGGGVIDELRISSVARSGDYISAVNFFYRTPALLTVSEPEVRP